MWSDIYCRLPFGICGLFFCGLFFCLPSSHPLLFTSLVLKLCLSRSVVKARASRLWIIDVSVGGSFHQTLAGGAVYVCDPCEV